MVQEVWRLRGYVAVGVGLESCKIVFLGRQLLFISSDTFAV